MSHLATNQPLDYYKQVRNTTEFLCETLEIEDFVVQPTLDVSPLKWHLAHTTWFFETFVLIKNDPGYSLFHPDFAYLFNSYYIAEGKRWARSVRGQLTRPTVEEIFNYREYVDEAIQKLLTKEREDLTEIIELGINHEQQHQELFLYDIKRILGDNPLHPIFRPLDNDDQPVESAKKWLKVDEGLYEIGFHGKGFHFDNEKGRHKVFLHAYEVTSNLVTNGEFIEFIDEGGYEKFQFWLSDGWDWLNKEKIGHPRYWEQRDGEWWHYTLHGFEKVRLEHPLCHVSFYEADAFARWRDCRLPTEHEWEIACRLYSPTIPENPNFLEGKAFRPIATDNYDFYGNVWEWTSSPYVPYPYFKIADGAIGEYNGKFMINQMVLRGGSFGTSENHIRPTYRNFFHPNLRWLFNGFRLARYS